MSANKALGCWLHEGNSLGDTLRDEFMLNLFTWFNFNKLNIIAVVADTTGNMNKFRMKLQELNISHIHGTNHPVDSQKGLPCTSKENCRVAKYLVFSVK
jgi:hypothetical protein